MASGQPKISWGLRIHLWKKRCEHVIRNGLLAGFRLLYQRTRTLSSKPRSSEVYSAEIRRVLLMRTGRPLGDALMVLALIPTLKHRFPGLHIDLLLRDSLEPLFKSGTGADGFIAFPSRLGSNPLAFLRCLRDLRGRLPYDVIFACDAPFKTSFTTLCLALWTSAKFRIGFETKESEGFYDRLVRADQNCTTTENLLKLLEPLGGSVSGSFPQFSPSTEACENALQVMRGRNPVLLFVSNHWRKGGTVEFYLDLAERLVQCELPVTLAFGPGDSRGDDPRVKQWVSASRGLGEVLPEMSLACFAAAISQSRLFVSNDCGPYHLAVAVGTPTVGIFSDEEAKTKFGYRLDDRHIPLYSADASERVADALNACMRTLKAKSPKPVSIGAGQL